MRKKNYILYFLISISSIILLSCAATKIPAGNIMQIQNLSTVMKDVDRFRGKRILLGGLAGGASSDKLLIVSEKPLDITGKPQTYLPGNGYFLVDTGSEYSGGTPISVFGEVIGTREEDFEGGKKKYLLLKSIEIYQWEKPKGCLTLRPMISIGIEGTL